ncbi:kinase domain protein [Ancylostoma duodenale]|uniref:Serine/threonine-protein kinase receptor n=1 Tax=Ancylostoma duodenale TaxID=51022 RepID=A0A0C2CU21_9BILA|nr:kinase domain protein [Ancylostoma duodenale]
MAIVKEVSSLSLWEPGWRTESSDLSIPEEAVGRPQHPLPIRDGILDEETRNLCFCNYEGDICDANNTCIKHSHAACFHFMKEVYNSELRRMETVHQYGCATLEKGSSASHLTCNSFRSPHRTPKSIACCYEGNYCNLRITPPPYRQLPKEAEYYDDEWLESKLHPMFHVVVPLLIALFAIAIAATWCILKKRRTKKKQELLPTPELDPMISGSGSGNATMVQRTVANDLIIEKIIGKGRYGEVRIARFRGSLVAVKTFYTTEEDSWKNEREIYETQMLNHENILRESFLIGRVNLLRTPENFPEFVAADIFSMDSLTQMILVTDYHPLGSLYDYLQKEQALTTQEALQLAYSSICGIEHLHASVLGTGSRRKPQIAHRDIKSKNIIVKRPGVCCIADFGLAVRFEDRLIPEKVNIQVGTKRYMAPEVIRKALNPNFFAQFKMADMYSYALVLWEIARKVECADVCGTSIGSGESGYNSASSEGKGLTIYSEMKSDYKMQHMQKSSDGSRRSYPYKPPFGELVDSDPSFAEMEKIVCGANGKRPPLEPSWTNGSNNLLIHSEHPRRPAMCADVCGTSIGSGESGYNSASSEGKGLTIYSEMKSDYKMQHMQKSSDGSRRSYPYKPPFGELVDSDPSFAEMEKIVCGANGKRPPLEPSWTNGSNNLLIHFTHPRRPAMVHLQKMVSLMVDCWHHSPHCRHTALKVKIALGEVIEELLLLQEREAKERMTSQAMKVIDEEAYQPSRVVILGAQNKKENAHPYLATC